MAQACGTDLFLINTFIEAGTRSPSVLPLSALLLSGLKSAVNCYSLKSIHTGHAGPLEILQGLLFNAGRSRPPRNFQRERDTPDANAITPHVNWMLQRSPVVGVSIFGDFIFQGTQPSRNADRGPMRNGQTHLK